MLRWIMGQGVESQGKASGSSCQHHPGNADCLTLLPVVSKPARAQSLPAGLSMKDRALS